MTTPRPVGRSEVIPAVVDAAADLFADKGPAATSIREVAAAAGVNHGLVYRHFGTKEELVAAVLDALSEAEVPDERHWRVLARAILDGYPVGKLQKRFPVVGGLVDEARAHQPGETGARLAAGHAVALELGWRLFEPFIRSATGLEGLPEAEVRRASLRAAAQVLRGS